jgi:hypothetical protein
VRSVPYPSHPQVGAVKASICVSETGYEIPVAKGSISGAMPGSSRPSSSSKNAPPPVEMCVIRSATPAWFTAATVSPPPTMEVAC